MTKLYPLLLAIALCGCATGSRIVTGSAHAQIEPDVIRICPEPPSEKYEVIGLVSAWDGWGMTYASQRKRANEQIKVEAAKLGANGVIVKDSRFSFWTGTTIDGTAIFILPKEPTTAKQ